MVVAGTVVDVVNKVLLVALVVVLVLVGLPLPVPGMAPMTCIDCEQPAVVHFCVAVLFAALSVVVAVVGQSITWDRRRMLAVLLGGRLDRPPQTG